MCEFEIVFRYFDLCYQVVTYRRQLLILPVLLFHLKENVINPCSWLRWSKGEWYQNIFNNCQKKERSFLQHVEVWPFVPGSWLSSPSSSAEQSVWRSRRPGGTGLLVTVARHCSIVTGLLASKSRQPGPSRCCRSPCWPPQVSPLHALSAGRTAVVINLCNSSRSQRFKLDITCNIAWGSQLKVECHILYTHYTSTHRAKVLTCSNLVLILQFRFVLGNIVLELLFILLEAFYHLKIVIKRRPRKISRPCDLLGSLIFSVNVCKGRLHILQKRINCD